MTNTNKLNYNSVEKVKLRETPFNFSGSKSIRISAGKIRNECYIFMLCFAMNQTKLNNIDNYVYK